MAVAGDTGTPGMLGSASASRPSLLRHLVWVYRTDAAFRGLLDFTLVGTIVLLFLNYFPSNVNQQNQSSPTTHQAATAGATTGTATTAATTSPASSAIKGAAAAGTESKPTSVATTTPQSTLKPDAAAASTTPAAPVIPIQFTDDVTHPSLANALANFVITIDDSTFSHSAAANRQKLTDAARAFRSQQFAMVVETLKDADAADANVAFLRGIAELNMGGAAEAASAAEFLRIAADAGNPQAAALLGRLLVKPPQGATKDLARGRQLIEDAAAAGDHLAQRLAGMAYLSGEFGVVNAAKARSLFRTAAEAGDAPATLFYAFMLSWALGGPGDQPTAADFLRRAAAAGLTRAQDTLGVWLLDRYKQKAIDDPREGVEWLERAYKKGYSTRALSALTLFYGDQGHPPPWNDKSKVSELAYLCSGLNYSWCQAENGWAFQFGIGRNRDLVKAFAHYQVALELGSPSAAKSLQIVESLLKSPAEKTAGVELSETIRAHLKSLGSMWVMQYVGADPPPSFWATATYGGPTAATVPVNVPKTGPAAAAASTGPTAAATSAQPADGGPAIVLRKASAANQTVAPPEPNDIAAMPGQTVAGPSGHVIANAPNIGAAQSQPESASAATAAVPLILRKPN